MSEYMERFTGSRLIGSPPGYVGYEEGGQPQVATVSANWDTTIGEIIADAMDKVGKDGSSNLRPQARPCPGSDRDSTHSAQVDYAELLPSLFELKAGGRQRSRGERIQESELCRPSRVSRPCR
jgi:hypothetical protein